MQTSAISFQFYMVAEGYVSGNTRNKLILQDELDHGGYLTNQYRKIVKAGIVKWVKDFQDGRIEIKIKIKMVNDLEKRIEIDIKLQKNKF